VTTKKKSPKKPSKASASKTSGKSTKKKSVIKKKTKSKPKLEAKRKSKSKTKATVTAAKAKPKVKAKPKATRAVVKDTVKSKTKQKDVPAKTDLKEARSSKGTESSEVDVHKQYKFKNYFESEPQLDTVDENSDVTDILAAYHRIIFVYAKRHLPPPNRPGGIELDDLIAQGQMGICDAVDLFRNPERRTPKYKFHMACLYRIRDHIYKYCIGNANQLNTPVYIQRGLMHVAQIFELMQSQTVAEAVLKKPGPASNEDIIQFLYQEDERLPLKSKAFIKRQINKKVSKKEFEQIYRGVTEHRRGSQHSYVKNNLSPVGKILHIKEKIWYTFKCNNMKYPRGIQLILSARRSQTPLEDAIHSPTKADTVESKVAQRELFERGIALCGKVEFHIVFDNTCIGLSYDEIAIKYKMKKAEVTDIVKKCIRSLRTDEVFIEYYKELK